MKKLKRFLCAILVLIALTGNAQIVSAHCSGPHGPTHPVPTDTKK